MKNLCCPPIHRSTAFTIALIAMIGACSTPSGEEAQARARAVPHPGSTNTLITRLPLELAGRTVQVESGQITVDAQQVRGARKGPRRIEWRSTAVSIASGKVQTRRGTVPGEGVLYPLVDGGFVQIIREKVKPADVDEREWRRGMIRFFNSDFTARGVATRFSPARLTADWSSCTIGVLSEPGRLTLLWNGELNSFNETSARVRVRYYDPRKGVALGAPASFLRVTGHTSMGVPGFFASKQGKLAVWFDEKKLRFATFKKFGRLAARSLSNLGMLSYFPDDVRGIIHKGGDISICWMTWNKKREQHFKKHLWCKRLSPEGVPRGPAVHLTTRRAVPKGHVQVNERDLEIYINDLELTELPDGGLMVAWSVKDLSERHFFPLGIYAQRLSPKGQALGRAERVVQVARKENLDNHIEAVNVAGGRLLLTYQLWDPMAGATLYQKRLPLK